MMRYERHPYRLPTITEKPIFPMITRLELCEHWRLWDDCYNCAPELPEDELLRDLGPEILIYLVSSTAIGTSIVTEFSDHA